MAVTTVEATDTLDAGRVKINNNFAQTLNSAVSGSDGLYPTVSLHQIPVMNAGSTAFEFFNYGKMAAQTDQDRLDLPKGLAVINWSVNLVNNWQWDEAQQRAEPFDVTFPMIGFELGGEGVISHYTAPGSVPLTSFHEINRFGGGVEGLSGVNSLTTYVPFNQFKATIYAAYSSTTTPPAATDESWWGGTGNTLGGVLNPLLWLNTEEVKGSGYNLNELAKFSAYGAAGAFPVVNFEKSNGTFQTKTAVTTNSVMARIGSNIWDGNSFENTATIDFLTRGTISDGNAGQSIRFSTSPTNTAGLLSRVEVTNDGALKTFIPIRQEGGTVTGVPSYTTVGFAPALTTSTSMNLYPFSSVNGGVSFLGLTNNTASAIPMAIAGVHGHTSPTAPAVFIAGRKHNGGTDWVALAAGEIVFQFRNHTTVLAELLGSGNMGFGVTTPGTLVHIGASTTSRAGLRVNPGAAPSSPANGDIWIDSTAHTMHVRINGVTKSIDLT